MDGQGDAGDSLSANSVRNVRFILWDDFRIVLGLIVAAEKEDDVNYYSLTFNSTIMKKVLIIFGGEQFSDGAFEFARGMNELEPIMLSGVFVPYMTYINLVTYAAVPMGGAGFVPLEKEETQSVTQNVEMFEKRCRDNGIAFRSHFNITEFGLSELEVQTRFSDLMIISSEKFYQDIVGEDAEDYLRDVLRTAECPVVIVPERHEFPLRNVFAYDGSTASLFAARQFMYLFPKLCWHHPSTIVYAKDEPDEIPLESGIRELAEVHLPTHDFLKLDLDQKKHFSSWIGKQRRSILIGGFSGKPRIGKLFGKNALNEVVAEHLLPVFMARR